MNFFDPTRQRINEQPCYIGLQSVLPHISISPGENNFVEAVVFVPSSDRAFSFSQRYATFSAIELITFIHDYKENPEAALCKHFNWSGKIKKQRATLTLEDLGL